MLFKCNLLKNNNINKSLRGALNNNLTFKFYSKSTYSNNKTNSTLLKLVNEHLLCRTCTRRRQQIRVRRPLNAYCCLIFKYDEKNVGA